MNSNQPSKFARLSKRSTNAAVSFASSSTAHQDNPTPRSTASRSSRLINGRFSGSRQGGFARNSRIERLNQANATRGQHSRAATVASIQGLMKKGEGTTRSQDQVPNLMIQVKPSETIEMSQLSEECSSNGSSAMGSGKSQFSFAAAAAAAATAGAEGGRTVRSWSFRKPTVSGCFLKSDMNRIIRTNDRRPSPNQAGAPHFHTKLVETPEGARSDQNRRKQSLGLTDSKTPRHRNGGREIFHQSCLQSFATASCQDDRFESEDSAAYSLGQGSSTVGQGSSAVHESYTSIYGNSNGGGVASIPAASDFAKTMRSEMESYQLWLSREQKKLKDEFAARIRQGEETINSHLSKSIQEASEHGASVVASVKKECDAAEKIAMKTITELEHQTGEAEKVSRESYGKMKKLSDEAKADVDKVKAESHLAHSLYEKATSVLKTVQESAQFVQSFFKKSPMPNAIISEDLNKAKLSTPIKVSSRDQGMKTKSSKVDTFIVIEDTSELENISPLTEKSVRRRLTQKPKEYPKEITALKERTSMANCSSNKPSTSHRKRATPSPAAIPSTPMANISAPNSIAPKRRRVVRNEKTAVIELDKSVSKSFIATATKKPPAARKSKASMRSTKNPLSKPIRKNRRKNRGNIVRGDIDFSLP